VRVIDRATRHNPPPGIIPALAGEARTAAGRGGAARPDPLCREGGRTDRAAAAGPERHPGRLLPDRPAAPLPAPQETARCSPPGPGQDRSTPGRRGARRSDNDRQEEATTSPDREVRTIGPWGQTSHGPDPHRNRLSCDCVTFLASPPPPPATLAAPPPGPPDDAFHNFFISNNLQTPSVSGTAVANPNSALPREIPLTEPGQIRAAPHPYPSPLGGEG
jgi:hypothetical protein